jgi:hypothetical protein
MRQWNSRKEGNIHKGRVAMAGAAMPRLHAVLVVRTIFHCLSDEPVTVYLLSISFWVYGSHFNSRNVRYSYKQKHSHNTPMDAQGGKDV